MKRWLSALFAPLFPPKNFSVADRDFDAEYRAGRDEYLKKHGQCGLLSTKIDLPLAGSMRNSY